jgi:hypothetical protein
MQHYSLPTVRALVALGRGDGKQALELLEATSGYEFGSPQSFAVTEPPLYPLYVRGEAYTPHNPVARNPRLSRAEHGPLMFRNGAF